MIRSLKLCLHKQIRITKVNTNFGTTATIVVNTTTLIQTVLENNNAKTKKENGNLDVALENFSNSDNIFLRIDFHRGHVEDLYLHLENLTVLYNQMLLKILINILKTFQSQRTKLNC